MNSSISGIIRIMPNMRRSRLIWMTSFQTMCEMRESEATHALTPSRSWKRDGAEPDDADAEHSSSSASGHSTAMPTPLR